MTWYTLLPLVTFISWGMRILPFAIGPYLKRFSFLNKLEAMLPCCLLIMITAYTIRDINFREAPFGLPEIVALTGVVLTQVWLRSSLVSMIVGVLIHQFLRVIFLTS